MPFKLAIASGKGGTGKTTVSMLLHNYFGENLCDSINLVDCDVEEPNARIFFKNAKVLAETPVYQKIPSIHTDSCSFCKKCVDYCEFNAISMIPAAHYAQISADLCHSCGACLLACEFDAITEHNHSIGSINLYSTDTQNHLTEGKLRIGSTMQTMLIRELKKQTSKNTDFLILDAPPGTSCPVVETIADANFVILVAEPTPFGLHDLKLTVELLQDIKIPFGIVINKAGLGSDKIYEFIEAEQLNLLGEIPFSREYATHYSKGNILDKIYPKVLPSLKNIAKHIEKELLVYEGNNYFIW